MPENRIKPVTNVLENAYTLLHLSWSCVGYNTIIVNHVHSIGQPTGSKPNALRSAPFKTICLVYFSNTLSFRRVPHFIEGLSCQTSQHFIRHSDREQYLSWSFLPGTLWHAGFHLLCHTHARFLLCELVDNVSRAPSNDNTSSRDIPVL